MHDVAQYPIFPGIHSTPILQFTVDQDVWDSLTPAEQTTLEVWFEAAFNDMRRAVDLEDRKRVARDRAERELTIIEWPQEERDKLRAIARNARNDFAAGSELAQETYQAHLDFMKEAGLLVE